jgi:hypothetical protein
MEANRRVVGREPPLIVIRRAARYGWVKRGKIGKRQ